MDKQSVTPLAILVGIVLLAFLACLPIVHASGDGVNLADLPQQLADALTIDLFSAQILTSVLFMCLFLFPTLLLAKKNQMLLGVIVGLGTLGFTVAVGWMPYWVLLIIALITAMMFAGDVRGLFSGD
jgi:hypothetical protein